MTTVRAGVTKEQARAWLATLPTERDIIEHWEDRGQRETALARLAEQEAAIREFLKC